MWFDLVQYSVEASLAVKDGLDAPTGSCKDASRLGRSRCAADACGVFLDEITLQTCCLDGAFRSEGSTKVPKQTAKSIAEWWVSAAASSKSPDRKCLGISLLAYYWLCRPRHSRGRLTTWHS